MTNYLRVRDFELLQHYKERDPPWIKLYFRMLDDYAFTGLTDPGKWHLIGIFLLASRCDNRIVADARWVRKKIGARTAVDLAALEAAGFLEKADEMLATCKQRASPETEAETETETETETEGMSAGADHANRFCSKDFEEFWKAYPTDPLMSKKRTLEAWQRMDNAERRAAADALPAFRAFVGKQVNYRVVHAWKYLTERRYDGFLAEEVDPAAAAETADRADRLLKRGKYAETKA